MFRLSSRPARLALAAVLVLPAALASAGAPKEGAPEEGEAIFTRGARPGAPAPRATAGAGMSLPATAMPCAGCHGADGGGGRLEAGLRPPALAWSVLSRPAPGRPAYDEALLLRAIALGFDSGGRALDPAMPRYALSLEDGRALLAHLRALDARTVPGVEAAAVHLGLLLPPGPGGEAFRAAFADALAAAAPDGVFGRRIVWHPLLAADATDPAARLAALGPEGMLALVSALPEPVNAPLLAAAGRLPVLSARATLAEAPQRHALVPGAAEEALALLRRLPRPERAVILHGGDAAGQRLAEAITGRLEGAGEAPPRLADARTSPAGLDEAEAILLLPPARSGAAFLAALGGIGQSLDQPLLAPGSLGITALRTAAAAAGRPVLAAFAVPLAGGAGAPAERYATSPAARAGLAGRLGHAAAEVMVEALRRSGQRLTREGLAAVLEAPEGFEPGALPRLRLAGPGQPGSLARQPLLLLIDGEGGARRPPGTGE